MPLWVNRNTFRVLPSVAEADLPEPVGNYVREPDLSAVNGQPTIYWILTGDIFTLMNGAEQDVADAAQQDIVNVDNRAESIAALSDTLVANSWALRELIELFNKRDNYLTNRMIQVQEDMQAIRASNGPADNIRSAIRLVYLPTNTRTRADAIQDYTDDVNAGGADT